MTDEAQDPPAEADASVLARAKEGAGRLVSLGLKLLPWGSLVVGIVSAFLQDRSPGAAKLIIPAAVVGWVLVLAFGALQRLDESQLSGKRAMLLKVGRMSTLILMQSLMQQCLFFAIPFYVLSASFAVGHIAFLGLLIGAAGLTLWDPAYEKAVELAVARFGLQFLSTFVSVNAMLPALGMTNQASLYVSGAVAALGIPLQGWVLREGTRRETAISAVLAAIGLPVFLVLGGGASIPPAPLALMVGEMGTAYDAQERKVADPKDEVTGVPPALVCATAIRAPHGLDREKLFHVWTRPDGKVSDRIPLTIHGGRKAGFRTYSKKSKLGKAPWGTWTCSTITETGQLVGRRSIDVLDPKAED